VTLVVRRKEMYSERSTNFMSGLRKCTVTHFLSNRSLLLMLVRGAVTLLLSASLFSLLFPPKKPH
jgi:hypothetical protein